jgi:hypothetical protein
MSDCLDCLNNTSDPFCSRGHLIRRNCSSSIHEYHGIFSGRCPNCEIIVDAICPNCGYGQCSYYGCSAWISLRYGSCGRHRSVKMFSIEDSD